MNRTVSTWVRTRSVRVQRGFTLVELLVVIAIIGLLVGLTVPAVFGVRGAFNRASVKFEVQALNDAVENYRSKYGDYPPDGSSWQIMEAHLRKAFPDILQSELNLLNPTMSASQVGTVAVLRNDNDPMLKPPGVLAIHFRVMDPAEAVVFFLGGFSSDKQRPFTGPGGPFAASVVAGQGLQYNVSRQNPFFEFPTDRLSLAVVNGVTISTDESVFVENIGNDLLPVFMSKGNEIEKGSPYVYFDSRTYQFTKNSSSGPFLYFNFFQPSNANPTLPYDPLNPRLQLGAARPFLSEQVNTATSRLFYENKQTFQIVSPGTDGKFGGRVAQLIFPSGNFPNDLILFTSRGKPTQVNSTAPVGFGPSPGSGPALILPEHLTKRPMQDDASNCIANNTLGEST